jgi:hypothetical protein
MAEIKKFIEHVVLIADKTAQAFIEEDLARANGAIEQIRAADELYHRIKSDLAAFSVLSPDHVIRGNLLTQIVEETRQILDLVSGMARDVVIFLNAVEL